MTVTASEELFAPVGRDVELCYQTFGTPEDEPLLLVMGLGGLMTWWDAFNFEGTRWWQRLKKKMVP